MILEWKKSDSDAFERVYPAFQSYMGTSCQGIPEISDQELLKMATEFEKKHPQ